MRATFLAGALLSLAFLFSPNNTAHAQGVATSGEIRGTVSDPTGATVPKATVTAEDPEKGVRRTAVTETEGEYRLTGLPPSVYSVTVEIAGFQKEIRKDVVVSIGGDASARAAKNATSNNTQTAVTSKEYDNTQTEESEQENVNTIQPQTSNEPSNILPSNSNQDETVGILKQMNGNLEDMKNKSSEDNDQIQSPLSLINTISAPQNSSGSSPLSFAIQTTRDTCYNNRERIRNMILDKRAFA